jgi:hypothetical protein
VITFTIYSQRKDAAEKMNPLGVKLGESGLQNHFLTAVPKAAA